MASLRSIFTSKCPKCEKGEIYLSKNPYNLKMYDKIHKYCEVCGFCFENETGFYFGAMYVSYAICVAISLINFAIYMFIYRTWDYIVPFIIVNALILIALIPLVFRISRNLYLLLMDVLFPNKEDNPEYKG